MASASMTRKSYSSVSALYDEKADVLYVWRGGPQPAETEERDGLLLRFAFSDGTPCGVTVVGYIENGWNTQLHGLVKRISAHISESATQVESAIAQAIKDCPPIHA